MSIRAFPCFHFRNNNLTLHFHSDLSPFDLWDEENVQGQVSTHCNEYLCVWLEPDHEWAKYFVKIEYFDRRFSQCLDFQGCYTHKNMGIYVEKTAVIRKYKFREEIIFYRC